MKGAVRKLVMKTETFSRYKEQRANLLNGCWHHPDAGIGSGSNHCRELIIERCNYTLYTFCLKIR